jgi:hypothetical protein
LIESGSSGNILIAFGQISTIPQKIIPLSCSDGMNRAAQGQIWQFSSWAVELAMRHRSATFAAFNQLPRFGLMAELMSDLIGLHLATKTLCLK